MQPVPVQLSVRNVRKSFSGKAGEVQVLDDLSFDINERDFVSIIGPSGCGKTTIFNIIAGLLEPDSGSLHYRGEEIESLRGRVGYMMQKDLLFPWRTVLGNVLLGLETRGVDRIEAEAKAREYLRGFGLSGFENAYPKTLSGGMRQRVALIRTLIMDPDILLLDEPFSALDYQTRLYLEGVLKDAVETYHKTVILVTHDIDEAVALSKRVVVLSGRPARVKTVHDIEIDAHLADRGAQRPAGSPATSMRSAPSSTSRPRKRVTMTLPEQPPMRNLRKSAPPAAREPSTPRSAARRCRRRR
jgi:NitT/TauT family transport system ATP-binding protein